MAIVTTDNRHYMGIASALREKTGTATEYKPEEMAAGVNDVYEAGQQSEYDRFWDAFQQNGERTSYDSAFQYNGWSDDIYSPKYPIKLEGTNGGRQTFNNNTNLADIKVPIYAKNTRLSHTFNLCTALKTIPLLHVENVAEYTNAFASCKKLENVTFSGSVDAGISFVSSPLLSDASVQSVIHHLADLTGKTAQTLTFHADVGARLTEAQKATVTAKNWTLVY